MKINDTSMLGSGPHPIHNAHSQLSQGYKHILYHVYADGIHEIDITILTMRLPVYKFNRIVSQTFMKTGCLKRTLGKLYFQNLSVV